MSAAAGGGEKVAAEERSTEDRASAAEKVLAAVAREGLLLLLSPVAEQETESRARGVGEERRGLEAKAVDVAMEAARAAIAAGARVVGACGGSWIPSWLIRGGACAAK